MAAVAAARPDLDPLGPVAAMFRAAILAALIVGPPPLPPLPPPPPSTWPDTGPGPDYAPSVRVFLLATLDRAGAPSPYAAVVADAIRKLACLPKGWLQ